MKMTGYVGLGIAAAIFASILVGLMQFETPAVSSPDAPPGYSKILIASADIPAGQRLKIDDVEESQIVTEELPKGAVRSIPLIVGRVAIRPLGKGQVVMNDAFAAPGSGPEIAEMLGGGMRAITLTLGDPAAGVVLYPGALVDVMSTLAIPRSKSESGGYVTTTVLRKIRVLAVDDQVVGGELRSADGASNRKRRLTLTLLVDPNQAQLLELASAKGTLAVALRSPDDTSEAVFGDANLATLLQNSLSNEGARTADSNVSSAATSSTVFPLTRGNIWTVTVIKDGRANTHEFDNEIDTND